MLSDVTMPDGKTLRPELRRGGAWATATTEGAMLAQAVIVAADGCTLNVPLEGEREGNRWHRRGRTVCGINPQGDMVIGRVLSTCERWVAISSWTAMGELTGCRWSMRTARGLAPLGAADCWREDFSLDRRDVVAAGACFPVYVSEGLQTDDWQHWRVGDATM